MLEIKDFLYITSITASLLFSFLNFNILNKNRRNTLREHLYKEQFNFFVKIMGAINLLNKEIQNLINDSEKRYENNFEELLKNVIDIYTISEFLPPEDIRGKCHNLIFKAEKFHETFLAADFQVYGKFYNRYYDEYSSLVDSIHNYMGTKSLSKENMELHSKNTMLTSLFLNLKKRLSVTLFSKRNKI